MFQKQSCARFLIHCGRSWHQQKDLLQTDLEMWRKSQRTVYHSYSQWLFHHTSVCCMSVQDICLLKGVINWSVQVNGNNRRSGCQRTLCCLKIQPNLSLWASPQNIQIFMFFFSILTVQLVAERAKPIQSLALKSGNLWKYGDNWFNSIWKVVNLW